MELVRIISRNKAMKIAERRPPEPPYFNAAYFNGQARTLVGNAECIVRVDGRLQTRHCDPHALPKAKDFQPER